MHYLRAQITNKFTYFVVFESFYNALKKMYKSYMSYRFKCYIISFLLYMSIIFLIYARFVFFDHSNSYIF